MPASQIALLGAIAGFTIYLGLPIGRLPHPAPRTRALLNALATGILIFLLWDVLAHAWEPVDGALGDHHYGTATVDGLAMAVAVGAGLLGLVYFDQWIARRSRRALGGDASAPELTNTTSTWRGPAGQLAMLIAVGIGLHNFAEGLAIGNSAASGEIAPGGSADRRLRPAQRDRRFRHCRAAGRGRGTPVVGTPGRARPHRRRPDVPRYRWSGRASPATSVDRVPVAGRRLDPLRRHRTPRGCPPDVAQARHHLGHPHRPRTRLRHRRRSSPPAAPNRARLRASGYREAMTFAALTGLNGEWAARRPRAEGAEGGSR